MPSKQLQNAHVSVLDANSTRKALIVHTVDESGAFVSPGAGSTQVSVRGLFTSSNAEMTDSTQASLRVSIVEGSGAGSTLNTVRQSSYVDLNGLMRLGDRDVSTNIANITNTTPASTAYALAVREVAPSTTVAVSTGSVRVHQSTAADLAASVVQGSTVWPVQVPSSQSFQVKNSTIGDLLASVQQNSTVWVTQPRLHTSSGGALDGSTTAPAAAALGLHVRPILPTLESTTVLITSSNSTATYALVSSAAGLRQKAFAYIVTSTVTAPSTFVFTSVGSSDNANADKWAFALGSGSSGITGANLAVSPPAWLFASIAADALKCRFESGSTGQIARVSLSWFSEA